MKECSDRLTAELTYGEFVTEARRHATEEAFRRSAFFQRHGQDLERLLLTPQVHTPRAETNGRAFESGDPALDADAGGFLPSRVSGPLRASGALRATRPLRMVQWNIEKGLAFEGIRRVLSSDPWLSRADLYCMNEVDVGTARGGNGDQAAALADALGCQSVYLPCFLECTKGVGRDLLAPGENRLGWHGHAILSRLPVRSAHASALPPCYDYFAFHEKRFGGRRGLYVEVDWNGRPLLVGTTHLEVRRTPRCRARQFAAFLRGFHEFVRRHIGSADPIPSVLAGDWNTNTFRRGNLLTSVMEFLRLVRTAPGDLEAELLRPFRREPLFDQLRAAGFQVESLNEAAATAMQDLGQVEDLALLPSPLARWVERTFHLSNRRLAMRLDWIAARGLMPAGAPRTAWLEAEDGAPLSDHALIAVELAVESEDPPSPPA